MEPLDVVTGAFSYSGSYLARRLQQHGRRVRTLTNNPAARDGEIEVRPLRFDDRAALVDALRGVSTFYNTYWVRFAHGAVDYERAVANTRTLFAAAREAGVARVVHVSITNANESSPLPYFKWKGVLERELSESGLSHAIVRPTVIFGREDILINNIAWLLRRLPIFVVPSGGEYRLQPVYVEDLAELCANAGARGDDIVIDAVGPETYRFDELVRVVRRAVGSRSPLVPLPPMLALTLSRLVGAAVRDVVLTRDEIDGLRATRSTGCARTCSPPTRRRPARRASRRGPPSTAQSSGDAIRPSSRGTTAAEERRADRRARRAGAPLEPAPATNCQQDTVEHGLRLDLERERDTRAARGRAERPDDVRNGAVARDRAPFEHAADRVRRSRRAHDLRMGDA